MPYISRCMIAYIPVDNVYHIMQWSLYHCVGISDRSRIWFITFCRLAAENRIIDLQQLVEQTFQQFALEDSEEECEESSISDWNVTGPQRCSSDHINAYYSEYKTTRTSPISVLVNDLFYPFLNICLWRVRWTKNIFKPIAVVNTMYCIVHVSINTNIMGDL